MSRLEGLENNIKAAQELYEQAKAERDEYVIQLVKEGKAEEIVEGEWRERAVVKNDVTTIRFYCNNCMAFARSSLRSRRCPYCGARMANGTDRPEFATPIEYAPETNDENIKNADAASNPTSVQVSMPPLTETPKAYESPDPPLDLELLRIRYAVKDMETRTKSSKREIAKLFGISDFQLYKYMRDTVKPRKATIAKIGEVYKDLTGNGLPSSRAELETYLGA